MRRTRGEGVQQPVIDELRSGIRVASLTHPASLSGRGFPPLSGTGAYDPAIPCSRSSPSFSPRLRRVVPPVTSRPSCLHLLTCCPVLHCGGPRPKPTAHPERAPPALRVCAPPA